MSNAVQESIDRLNAALSAYEQEDAKDNAFIARLEGEIQTARDRILGRVDAIQDCKAAIAKLQYQ